MSELLAIEAAQREHLEALSASPRVPHTRAHAQARQYILDALRNFGLEAREQAHPSAEVINVHAFVGPPGGARWIVGAHYDSVPGSPGADDNASGVAALLELGRALAASSLQRQVELVAYDREEDGLLGSRAHVGQLQREGAEVAGMISLEMLGYTSPEQLLVPGVAVTSTRGDFLAVVANGASAPLLRLFEEPEPVVATERVVVPSGSEAEALAHLSDHGAFWMAGWPALLVTDTAFLRNPHYHQPSDTPATLDFGFLARSTVQVMRALRRLGDER